MKLTKYNLRLNDEYCNVLAKERTEDYYGAEKLGSMEDVYRLLVDVYHMDKMAEEYVYMIALNTKSRPLGIFEVSHGSVDAAMLQPREIYTRALLCGASAVIIAHNHPSGDPTPSREDINITKRIRDAGTMIGIQLLDHIIIGDGRYFSMHEIYGKNLAI